MPKPPAFFSRFLKWFCKPSLHPYLEGDLIEHFHQKAAQHGHKKASRSFALDVIRLFRPGIIRSFIPQKLNTINMLKHSLTFSVRHFRRYPGTFLINLLGLTSGLIVVLFIYLWVQDETGMDKFHKNESRLHQVYLNFDNPSGIHTVSWTPARLSPAINAEIPEIETSTRFYTGSQDGVISYEKGAEIRAHEAFADNAFFKMFSFEVIAGNTDQLLTDRYAVVISEELALKLFNTTEHLLGKSLSLVKKKLDGDYIITGVFKKESKSTLNFDAVFSMEQLITQKPNMDSWVYNDPATYVLLKEKAKPENVNSKIEKFLTSQPNVEVATTLLTSFSDNYLYGTFKNGRQSGGRVIYVRLFSGIALIILCIACINFVNLSTAQTTRRVKEVGVKKAVGIHRGSLIFQFLAESTLVSFIALLLATGITYLLIPGFNGIVNKNLSLTLNGQMILGILTITLCTGLLAGIYPALHMSGFKTTTLLKGKLSVKSGGLWLRKGLVIFQFTTSLLLIIAITVVQQQTDLIQNKNLGYNRDNVLTFPIEGEISKNVNTFLKEVSNIPGVVSATASAHDIMVNQSNNHGVDWEGKDPEAVIPFKYLNVNYNFNQTLGIEFIAGRPFSRKFANESSKIILNETAVKTIGLENPIGAIITVAGQKREVIGVVQDFHFESLYEEIKPLFYTVSDRNYDILLRIQAGIEHETIERIKSFYADYNNGLSLDFQFLDSKYQQLYESETRAGALSGYFAAIAIIISCLGLFGLTTFATETRIKEIGIRKVLGARITSIVGMLASEFAKMILIAIIIALPIGYWLAGHWLNEFAYHTVLSWWVLVFIGLATMAFAMLTIALRTIKAASTKPTDCLRYE